MAAWDTFALWEVNLDDTVIVKEASDEKDLVANFKAFKQLSLEMHPLSLKNQQRITHLTSSKSDN